MKVWIPDNQRCAHSAIIEILCSIRKVSESLRDYTAYPGKGQDSTLKAVPGRPSTADLHSKLWLRDPKG